MHTPQKTNTWLWVFFIGYCIIWCILPACFSHSVFPDTAENLALSHALSWSYSKHPPMGMALLHAIQYVIPSNEWAAAFANALCLITSLFGVYRISRHYLPKHTAAASTIISSLCLYFILNFAIQYNQNTIMLPFWVGIIGFTLRAEKYNHPKDWLLLSLMVAGGMLAKYETIMIIGLAFIYLMCHLKKEHIKYLSMTFCFSLLLLTPHILWVANHGFDTITYLFTQSSRADTPFLHVFLGALLAQPSNLLLALLLTAFFALLGCFKRENKRPPFSLLDPLAFFALTPWAGFVLLALFATVKAEWGFPILLLAVPAFFYYSNIKTRQLNVVTLTILAIHLLLASAYGINTYRSHHTHRANWPSHTLAEAAQDFWDHYHPNQPLHYIAGDEYPIYYLSAYLPQRPLMLKNNSFKDSTWINKSDFFKHGAIFVRLGCHDNALTLKEKGFAISHQECISLPQANKWSPEHINFTLYILPPRQQRI